MTDPRTTEILNPTFRRWASSIVLAVSIGIVAFLTLVVSSPITQETETFRLRRFFTAQAEAILQGRLWVNPVDLPDECFTADGRCYGYFGVTPSLLRIPFLWLTGDAGLTDWFVMAGLILAVFGNLVLVNLVWRMARSSTLDAAPSLLRNVAFLVSLIAAGPGSLLVQLTLPTGYEEAIIWAAAFTSWGLVCILRWVRVGTSRWLGCATFFFVLAANARPSAAPVAVIAAATILVYLLGRRVIFRELDSTIFALALGFLPGASMISVWLLKFGVMVPPLSINEAVQNAPHWAKTMAINGGHDSWWGFIPTNFVQYLRPDNVVWTGEELAGVRPGYEGVLYVPPLEPGGLFVTPMASITSLVPVVMLALPIVILLLPRLVSLLPAAGYGAMPRLFTLGLGLAAWSSFGLLLVNVGVQNRYMGDVGPAIAMTVALAAVAVLTSRTKPGVVSGIIIWLMMILALSGVAISILHQMWQIERYL